MKRIRTLAAGISLVLLIGSLGLAPAVAQDQVVATETSVSIPAQGHDIPGTLALPEGVEGAVPAVLLLHGFGSSKDEVGNMYARLAEALAERGIGSLRIDFAGMGDSEASMLDYTYDSQIADAETALEWLLAQDTVDPERVGVQGFSLGSMIAAHLAGTDRRIAALGSWSGSIYDGDQFFFGPEMLAECEATGQGHLEMDLGWRTIDLSCEFFSSHLGSTALSDLAPYANPLLLVAGSEDTDVDPSVSENAAKSTASEDVTLEIIEGADHIYRVLGDDQALADQAITFTADWYAEKLQ